MENELRDLIIEALKDSRTQWKDLAEKHGTFLVEHTKIVTEISQKISSIQGKALWKDGKFWVAIIPWLVIAILGGWALATRQCLQLGDKSFGCINNSLTSTSTTKK